MFKFLKELFFGKEYKKEDLVQVAVEPVEVKKHVRNAYAAGSQRDPNTYWLIHKDGTAFAGTPTEFGVFEAKRRGISVLKANQEAIMVYLLAEKAKGKVGSRKGWKLQ